MLNGLVHLPLVLPPVVTGYLLLLTFGRRGPIGGLLESCCGIVFAFRWTGAALAAGGDGVPADGARHPAVDRGGGPAARAGGARRSAPSAPWVFLTVTLPLILPGIIAGSILAFAKAMGEFGATITFVSNIPGQTRTIPSAIYAFLQVPGGENEAMRLVVVVDRRGDDGAAAVRARRATGRAQGRRRMTLAVRLRHAFAGLQPRRRLRGAAGR